MPPTSQELLDRIFDYSARKTPTQQYFLKGFGEHEFSNICPHNRTVGRGLTECRLMAAAARIHQEIIEQKKF